MSPELSASAVGAVRDAIERKYALTVSKGRLADLERGLARIAAERGISVEIAAELAIREVSGDGTAGLLDSLVRSVTIGETYFFRHPDQFRALESEIIPGLVRARLADPDRGIGKPSLSIWSAGSSSGEEAYSLAISVSRVLGESVLDPFLHAAWDIQVIGTDINRESLDIAGRGAYREWSFRGVAEADRAPWFEADGTEFRVRDFLRRITRFSLLNLADGVWPETSLPDRRFDIVFCRNVLMYFPRGTAIRILSKIRERMSPDGWLAVAPSEVPIAHEAGFHAVRFSGCTLFSSEARRRGRREQVPAVPAAAARTAATRGAAAPVVAAPPAAAAAAKPPRSPLRAHDHADVLLQKARAAADSRDFATAGKIVAELMAHDSTDYRAHLLKAIVAMESGDDREAMASLTRTLFLRPDSVPALVSMGNLLRASKFDAEAIRHFDAAIRVLKGMDPGAVVPDSEGIAAGTFLSLAYALRGTKEIP